MEKKDKKSPDFQESFCKGIFLFWSYAFPDGGDDWVYFYEAL
jgi:hypothetical protein